MQQQQTAGELWWVVIQLHLYVYNETNLYETLMFDITTHK